MARYKLGPDGAYLDENDTGPDQASPEQIAALKGTTAPAAGPSAPGPTSDAGVPYSSEGAGGLTGKGPVGLDPSPYTAGQNGSVTPAAPAPAQAPAAPAPQTPYAAMEGVDVNKMNDPTHNSEKYTAARILASGGDIAAAAQSIGATVVSADKMRLKSGEIVDIRRDIEGANALQWTPMGWDAGDPRAPAGAAGAGSAGLPAGGAPGAGGSGNAFTDQVRSALMAQMGKAGADVTGQDPQIKAEMDAQGAVLERNRRDRRASDAERSAMSGLLSGGQSSGSFDQNVASGWEDKGQALTGIQAQLFTRELQSRRTQMSQLLSMALNSGDNESARALQMQLATMDDQMNRMRLKQNQGQWDDSYSLDVGKFRDKQNQDVVNLGLGR